MSGTQAIYWPRGRAGYVMTATVHSNAFLVAGRGPSPHVQLIKEGKGRMIKSVAICLLHSHLEVSRRAVESNPGHIVLQPNAGAILATVTRERVFPFLST